MRVGVTGSEGLLGRALVKALETEGHEVKRLDLRLPATEEGHGDVADPGCVGEFAHGCAGIVHFAAVSRVAWGESDPVRCERVNVAGTENVLRAAGAQAQRPWVLFASSREVYGQTDQFPVREDAALRPVNVYGRTKLAAERLVSEAGMQGLRVSALRLSNVYGSVQDHVQRVVPAFTRAAAMGQELRVDGAERMFDFTHLADVLEGLLATVKVLSHERRSLPVLHLASGRGVTLGALARMAVAAGGHRARVHEAGFKTYDVERFVGVPTAAEEVLGWKAKKKLEDGIAEMVKAWGAAGSVLAEEESRA